MNWKCRNRGKYNADVLLCKKPIDNAELPLAVNLCVHGAVLKFKVSKALKYFKGLESNISYCH